MSTGEHGAVRRVGTAARGQRRISYVDGAEQRPSPTDILHLAIGYRDFSGR
jgi:hypothetical protein